MARSRLTYAEAVKILTGGTDYTTLLGRLAGGALLLASPFSGLALSLFDAEGEANALLRDLVGKAPGRIRSVRGRSHYELIEAAHAVLVISCFFDAFAEHAGTLGAALELTDEERHRIARVFAAPPPMPGATQGFEATVKQLEIDYGTMQRNLVEFASGLASGAGRRYPDQAVTVSRAVDLYRERYVRLAADLPEFALWSQLGEHAATRQVVHGQTETLAELGSMLTTLLHGGAPAVEAEQRLARHARLVLDRRLWRTEPAAGGPAFPTVREGFVSPHFRMTVAGQDARLGDESWWRRSLRRDDLAEFLTACVTDSTFTERPLLVLGHPGAGKSLLTEILAARLPESVFTTIRVPLRQVDPDADIHQQIERTVEQLVKERLSWGDLCRASDTTKVVLLDGFDELVQATGVTQSHYIERVARFQREEWVNDRPVIVVITSRTLVMDRTVVPPETVVVKLEPFDTQQIERWITAWNAANTGRPGFRPLSADELDRHADLAGQPLLLMMLGVYAAESGVRLDDEQLDADELYRRLLDTFIRRQIRDKGRDNLGDRRFIEHERGARHDLSIAAFAMFNRGRQFVSEEDLERDLDALRPVGEVADAPAGEPLSRAKRTVAAFFFVHVAQAGDDARTPGRRSYEFLHATFAEYLVAEHTVDLLTELLHDWRRPRRSYGARLDDAGLRDLLSHRPLTNGQQMVPFLRALLGRMPAEDTTGLRDALVELLGTARKRTVEDGAYHPTPFDIVTRLAAYTANLVVLAALCGEEGVAVTLLPDFESTVRLWRSGLEAEMQRGLFGSLKRAGDHLRIQPVEAVYPPVGEARLVGDYYAAAAAAAGQFTLLGTAADITAVQCDLHVGLVSTLAEVWPAPQLGRLTPFDERELLKWAGQVERAPERLHRATAGLLAQALLRDGQGLPAPTMARLVSLIPEQAIREAQPFLAVLGLSRPELLREHPKLVDGVTDFREPFVHEVARRSPDFAERRRLLHSLDLTSLSETNVVPSMVTGLVDQPQVMRSVLMSLATFGDLVWSQVRPGDLLAAASVVDAATRREVVVSYVDCRDAAAYEGEDADAFAQLRKLREEAAAPA